VCGAVLLASKKLGTIAKDRRFSARGPNTMYTQLNPTLPLHVLEKGDGYAIAVIDYGQEHNLIWVTVLNSNGEVWCAPNPSVRFGKNWTMGRDENPLIAQPKTPSADNIQTHQHDEGVLCSDCSGVSVSAANSVDSEP
jgi:hypothetical protein